MNNYITTGSGDDTVIQPALVDGLPRRNTDIINTNGGNDTINPGLGKYERVDGGTGTDHLILDYSVGDTGGGMVLNIFNNSNHFGSASRASAVPNALPLDDIQFQNIEKFTIIGTSKDDTIKTEYGTNIIQAGAGNDRVTAIAGNLTGTLDGGSGFDYLTLDLSKQTTNINLSNLSNISVAGITATNFERFAITTGSGNDTIIQSALLNCCDVLRASDTIKTGAGNDIINAGLGGKSISDADVVDGGAGIDRLIVDYSVGDTGTGMTFNAQCFAPYAYRNVSSTNSTNLDYIRFGNIEEFTVIGTSKNDTIKTDAGNDIIKAGAGNDTITGGKGGDTLTGGTGVDTFKYGYYTDSLLANYDVIKDLAIGSDVIDGPKAVSASQLKELGKVTALTETAIKQVLTTTNFSAYGAATFSFGDRTFLGINDMTAGFSASTDSIIEITGFTGSLTNLAII